MNPGSRSSLTRPAPLTHAGRAVVAGLEALVASPLGPALIAAVGVDAHGTAEGAHEGEAGALVFIWGDGSEGGKTRTRFERSHGTDKGWERTCAAPVLVQSKAMAALQHSQAG